MPLDLKCSSIQRFHGRPNHQIGGNSSVQRLAKGNDRLSIACVLENLICYALDGIQACSSSSQPSLSSLRLFIY